jgi:hypothetical protein
VDESPPDVVAPPSVAAPPTELAPPVQALELAPATLFVSQVLPSGVPLQPAAARMSSQLDPNRIADVHSRMINPSLGLKPIEQNNTRRYQDEAAAARRLTIVKRLMYHKQPGFLQYGQLPFRNTGPAFEHANDDFHLHGSLQSRDLLALQWDCTQAFVMEY